jgi:hypothetical protein
MRFSQWFVTTEPCPRHLHVGAKTKSSAWREILPRLKWFPKAEQVPQTINVSFVQMWAAIKVGLTALT